MIAYNNAERKSIYTKEYIATVVDKYATAGLTDSINYVIEVKTENNKLVLYINKELWDTIEENREYKLTIRHTNGDMFNISDEERISLELIDNTEEK